MEAIMTVNRKLKAAIITTYGSQIAFAADLGVDESLISRIVRGWRKPTEELQKLICEKLGVSSEIFSTN
jgi:transcriptional regulator with XRE-family HTH domain